MVVEELLALRGHGTTDLCLAFTAGRAQLERSTAPERLVVLLSDCRATDGDDHLRAAADLASSSRLVVVAPEADADTAPDLRRSGRRRGHHGGGPRRDPRRLRRPPRLTPANVLWEAPETGHFSG